MDTNDQPRVVDPCASHVDVSFPRPGRAMRGIRFVLLGLYVGSFGIWLARHGASAGAYEWGYGVRLYVFPLSMIWLISRVLCDWAGRSERVYDTAFSILIVFYFVARVTGAYGGLPPSAAFARTLSAEDRVRFREAQRLLADGTDHGPGDLQKRIDAARTVAKLGTGDEAAIAGAYAQLWTERDGFEKAVLKAAFEYGKAGANWPGSLHSREETIRRLVLLENVISAEEEFMDFVRTSPARMTGLLERGNVSAAAAARMSRDSRRKAEMGLPRLQKELDSLRNVLACLTLLRDEWGHWHYAFLKGAVFDESETRLRYEKLRKGNPDQPATHPASR